MPYLSKKTVFVTSCVLVIYFVVTFTSCDDGTITEDEYQIQYHRKEQLLNTYNNEILPLSDSFVSLSNQLKSVVEIFSQNATIENLENAQDKWLEMLIIWKRLELYNIGAVEDSYIHFEINRWPTNTENIDDNIDGTETINEAFITSIGSSSKGISALEYLLFSSRDNNDVLNTFIVEINYQRRLDYLVALTGNLNIKSQALRTIWLSDEEGFISSLENGISGTQSQLTNAMITLIEEVVISKVGNALGENSGGIVNAEALEAQRSETSLSIIQEHLIALNRCYKGYFIEKSVKLGYDDYLKLIGNENLDVEITNAFKVCQEKLDNIMSPLHQQIFSNPQNVVDLQSAFTDLLVLIKVDMANAIGTTVTINDNDGD